MKIKPTDPAYPADVAGMVMGQGNKAWHEHLPRSGMPIRLVLAMHAMQGICSNQSLCNRLVEWAGVRPDDASNSNTEAHNKALAYMGKYSLRAADALLSAYNASEGASK